MTKHEKERLECKLLDYALTERLLLRRQASWKERCDHLDACLEWWFFGPARSLGL